MTPDSPPSAKAGAVCDSAPRRASFLADVGSVLGSNIVILALSLVSSIVLARLLGPSGRGALAAVLVVPGVVISLLDMGVKQAAVYFLGKDRMPVRDVVSTVLLLAVLTSLAAVATAVGVMSASGTLKYGLVAVVLAVTVVPLRMVANYIRGVALGRKDVKYYNRINYFESPINLLGIVVLVGVFGWGYRGALMSYLVGAVVIAVYSLRYLRSQAPLVLRYVRGLPSRMLTMGAAYSAAAFALTLNYKVDVFLLDQMVSPAEVGWYALAANAAQLVWKGPAQAGPIVFARSADASDSTAFTVRMAGLVRVSLWFCVLGGTAFFFLCEWLIPVVYGSEFAASVGVCQLLIPGVVCAIVFKLLHNDFAGKGRPLVSLAILGPCAVVNVVLNLWWVPHSGIQGAALATTVTYSVAALLFAALYARLYGIPLRTLAVPQPGDLTQITDRLGGVIRRVATQRRGMSRPS